MGRPSVRAHQTAVLAAVLSSCCHIAAIAGSDEVSATAATSITIFFVDDLGYNDLSCFGGSEVVTPAIDRMAAEVL